MQYLKLLFELEMLGHLLNILQKR